MELTLSRSRLRQYTRVSSLRDVARIAASLTSPSRTSGRLLVVGTPAYEPWHLVAHLQSATASMGAVTLVRQHVPPGAPTHLSAGLDSIADAARTDSVLVIAADPAEEDLLQRLADARRRGSSVFAIAGEQTQPCVLSTVAHDTAVVHRGRFELAQHLLPAAARW